MSLAAIAWLVAVVGLLVVEFYALATKRELLSHVVWKVSYRFPLVPFLVGLLMGHLFWSGGLK